MHYQTRQTDCWISEWHEIFITDWPTVSCDISRVPSKFRRQFVHQMDPGYICNNCSSNKWKQEGHPLVRSGKTQRHSNWKPLQTFCASLVVTLHLTVADLFDSLLSGPVLRTVMQYSMTICSRPEAAIDVISDRFLWLIFPDKNIKFCDPHLNRSWEIWPQTVGGGIFIFGGFCGITTDRKKAT